MRIIAPLTAAVAGTLLAFGVVTATGMDAQAAPLKRLPACYFEDGSWPGGARKACYWDGSVRGNRVGSSYWFDQHGKQHFIKR